MKKLVLLIIVLVSVVSVKAQLDTIYMNLTVIQSDSLIQAHVGDTNFVILDVRQAGPYNAGHIQNAINIDYYDPNFSSLIGALDHNKIYLVHCQSGGRSAATFAMMQTQHFREVYNMLGGMNAWLGAGYSVVTTSGMYEVSSIESDKSLVSPNPVSESSYIDLVKMKTSSGKIEIYNHVGQMIISNSFNSDKIWLNKNDFEPGIYFYLITGNTKQIITGNFLVN